MDLVQRAAGGDQLAFARLAREYRGLLRTWSRDYFIQGASQEDVMQEAHVGLWKAVRDFRPDRHVNFIAFARTCVTRQVITAVKTASREKHRGFNEAIWLDKPVVSASGEKMQMDLPSRDLEPVERLVMRERYEQALSVLKWDMTRAEARALWLIEVEGLPYEQVAEMLGSHVKAVDNAVQRARRKLAAALEEKLPECRVCLVEIPRGDLCGPCGEELEVAARWLAA